MAEARDDYLSLPFNHPIRVAMRGLEVQLGIHNRAINEAEAAAHGGGLLSGILAGVGAIGGLVILGPAGIFLGGMAGATVGAVAQSTVRMRILTDNEWELSKTVFENSLTNRDNILITDMIGLGDRAYVIPGSSLALLGGLAAPPVFGWLAANPGIFEGKILVNLGTAFYDPVNHFYPNDDIRIPGLIFIHELTHVWQIQHNPDIAFIAQGIKDQTHDIFKDQYQFNPGLPFRDYNQEQQATIVETWYRNRQLGKQNDLLDPYIVNNIRPGAPNV